MILLLYHPIVAGISCRDCQDWMYDLKTGQLDKRQVNDEEWVADPRVGPPPCGCGFQCPKESPERERWHVLSDRNLQTWLRYSEQQAAGGAVTDAVTRRNFATLDGIYRDWQRHSQARQIAVLLAPLVVR